LRIICLLRTLLIVAAGLLIRLEVLSFKPPLSLPRGLPALGKLQLSFAKSKSLVLVFGRERCDLLSCVSRHRDWRRVRCRPDFDFWGLSYRLALVRLPVCGECPRESNVNA